MREREMRVVGTLESRASLCVTQSELSQGHIETCKLKISHTGGCICCVSASVCVSHGVGCTIMSLNTRAERS